VVHSHLPAKLVRASAGKTLTAALVGIAKHARQSKPWMQKLWITLGRLVQPDHSARRKKTVRHQLTMDFYRLE